MNENKINIVHIITELALGGAQKSTLTLIKSLSENNAYQHFLISSVPPNKEKSFLSAFIQIKALKIRLYKSFKRNIIPPVDIFFMFQLILRLKKIKPHIVHTHSSKAGILGRIAAYLTGTKKIIHTVHGFSFHCNQNFLLKNFYIFIERLTAKITSRLIFISENDMQKAFKLKIGNKNKNILIRDFMDLSEFQRTKKHQLSNNNQITIGTLSCLKKQKGLEYLFYALKELKPQDFQYKLVICGDGKEKKQLQKLADRLQISENIQFMGWQKSIPKIISTFDIFVLSSLWEGLPIAIAESMASGIPVIAPKINGIPELIKNQETGLLFEAKNFKKLAKLINLLSSDKNLYENLSKKAYNYIKENKEFSLTEVKSKIEDIYNDQLL